jgi:hypothetical protein
MTKEDFLKFLDLKNFPEPVLVEQPADGALDEHTHEFEVIALVIEGSISINSLGIESLYKSGEMFHLLFMQPHSERYGVSGVKYWASRRLRSTPG